MVLRSSLLFLSRQKQLRHWMETSGFADRLTSRFVAGRTLDDGLRVTRSVNEQGYLVTLDHLGENVATEAEAAAAADAYIKALRGIAAQNLESSVSIKLTQFGLDLGEEQCRSNVGRLVECARESARGVEVDMESSEYVDRTLALVEHFQARYPRVRSVLQAYLYRTAADVDRMNGLGIAVRLCKGAYNEPAEVAYAKKADVDASYVRLMKVLLEKGNYPALATHDERIIREAMDYVRQRAISADRFEFQMLYGIRRDLQRELIGHGYRLRLYIPYGDAWYPYFMRRLAERPANVIFLAKNLLRA
jgi:proline dehydrogenase